MSLLHLACAKTSRTMFGSIWGVLLYFSCTFVFLHFLVHVSLLFLAIYYLFVSKDHFFCSFSQTRTIQFFFHDKLWLWEKWKSI